MPAHPLRAANRSTRGIRLAQWWPAALIGLAALIGATPPGHAHKAQYDVPEAMTAAQLAN